MMLIYIIQGLCLLMHVFIIAAVKDIYVLEGRTVEFVCPFKGETTAGKQVKWERYITSAQLTLGINDRINNQTLDPELYNRLSVVGNHAIGEYKLQISGIKSSDEGKYGCLVGLNQDVQTLYLIVSPTNVNIENATPQDRLLATEGQDLTVSCVAVGGKPPPNVTLKVDGTTQATGNQSVTYRFISVSRFYDRKTVTCQASNEANANNPLSDSAVFYLNLRPLQPIFSSDHVSTEETKPLVVSCTSTGSRPQATFKWMIGLATITSGITTTHVSNTADDTYTVTSTLTHTVDRIFNTQTITCGAYNNVSTNGVIASTTLDVKYAPDITVTNVTYDQNTDSRILTCNPFGNPSTYIFYEWQHKSTYGVLIRELGGGQKLTLPSVPVEARYQESGEYICTAGNDITGRNGNVQQTGSGYVTVNAQPTFTKGNTNTEYGELSKDVDIHVYVYSVPKYTSVKWYTRSTEISMTANKYTSSEVAVMINDTFFGAEVKLDGYRITLTIKNLDVTDFNVSYIVEVSNGVGQSVRYNISLESASPPQMPANFAVLSSAEFSILVQWEPGYNGGNTQTFHIEYRANGSKPWESMLIPDKEQSGRHTFTLSGLQDDTTYEVRMYAENKFNKSSRTEKVSIKTIKGCKLSSSESVIGGVAGGLSAVIVILVIIITLILILWKRGTRKQRSKAQTSRWKDEISHHNQIACKEKDEHHDTQEERNKRKPLSAQEYETLGLKDIPSTYSELQTQQDNFKKSSAPEYETLEMTDNPNTYSELNGQQDQGQCKAAVDYYDSSSDQAKCTIYEDTKFQQGPELSDYTNMKI